MTVKVRSYRGSKNVFEVDIRFSWAEGGEYRERVRSPVSSLSGSRRWGEARERDLLSRGKPRPTTERALAPRLSSFVGRYWEEYCEANQQKPSTIIEKKIQAKANLLPLLGAKRLDEIDDAAIARFKAALSKGRTAKTVNNNLTLLSTILKCAVEWKVIERMPCTIKPLKTVKTEVTFYEKDEYQRLVEAARALDARKHLLVLLCGDAGLRRGEAIALRWDSVDFTRNVLRVMESETRGQVTAPKSGRSRLVPLTQQLAAALKGHRHLKGSRVLYSDELDEHGKPRGLSAKTVKCWVQACERKAGLLATGKVHVLRHTFCSHLAMAGVPVTAIQRLAGHSDLTTTMRYMHLSPSATDEAVKLLDASRRSAGVFGEMLEKAGIRSAEAQNSAS